MYLNTLLITGYFLSVKIMTKHNLEDFLISIQACTGINWHKCGTSHASFTHFTSDIWWIPHLFVHFYICFTKNVSVKAWKFECHPNELSFENLQTTGCFTSSVKITTGYSKKDLLVLITFCFYTFLYSVHLSQFIFFRLKCLFVTECNWLFHKQCVCFYDLVSLQTICSMHEPGVHSKFSSLQGNWASLFQKMTYMQVLVFYLQKHLRITYIMILCVD